MKQPATIFTGINRVQVGDMFDLSSPFTLNRDKVIYRIVRIKDIDINYFEVELENGKVILMNKKHTYN